MKTAVMDLKVVVDVGGGPWHGRPRDHDGEEVIEDDGGEFKDDACA